MSRKLMYGLVAVALAATSVEARPRPAPSAVADAPGLPTSVSDSSAYEQAPWWMNHAVITQTGSVYAEIPANRANFDAQFRTVADTVEKAQAKAIEQVRGLKPALDRLGKEAVRVTTDVSTRALYEEYRDKNGNKIEDQRADKINGYEVSLNLSLDVRDVAVLEKAYALVLAASPSSTGTVYFRLQPSNEQNSWLYTEAVKDAHVRALAAAEAAGGHLGAVRLIDPTGRACETDVLARGGTGQEANIYPDKSVADTMSRVSPMAVPPAPPPPPPPPPPGSAEALEAQALKNAFTQSPPVERIEAKACVVYGLN